MTECRPLPSQQENTGSKLPSLPKLVSIPDTVEMGTVICAPGIATSVQVQNVSDFPVQLKVLRTSCGCTTGTLEKDVLLPQETTKLVIQFSQSIPNPFKYTVYIACNGGGVETTHQCSVVGVIASALESQPGRIEITTAAPRVEEEKLYSATVSRVDPEDGPLSCQEVVALSSDSDFTVRTRDLGDSVGLDVFGTNETALGKHVFQITVGHIKRSTILRIPAEITITSPIDCVPDGVNFELVILPFACTTLLKSRHNIINAMWLGDPTESITLSRDDSGTTICVPLTVNEDGPFLRKLRLVGQRSADGTTPTAVVAFRGIAVKRK